MTYNCILFDWDGCIVDTLPLWFNAYSELFPEHGIIISDEEVVKTAFHYLHTVPGIEKLNYKEFVRKVYDHVQSNIPNVVMCTNVMATLKELKKRGKKIAIITSTTRETWLMMAQRLECADLFDIVITRDDVEKKKPDPEPLEKAMRELNMKPEETLIIGDSDADIKAGKNAGVTAVWFYPEENKKFYQKSHFDELRPDFIIENMQDLFNIVK